MQLVLQPLDMCLLDATRTHSMYHNNNNNNNNIIISLYILTHGNTLCRTHKTWIKMVQFKC